GGRDLRELAPVRLAVIGPETANELRRRLLCPAVEPTDYRAEGLLDALGRERLQGARILLPRAAGARVILPETLRARGARVDEVIAYRAVAPAGVDVAALRAALEGRQVDALTFTSSSTVRNFAALLGEGELPRLVRDGRPVVACIGPVTAETARECGLPVTVVPPTYTAAALAAALVDHFCHAPMGVR